MCIFHDFSDDIDNKSGFTNAVEFINGQMSQFFNGRELPLSKKVFDQLANWVDRIVKRAQE